MYIINKLLQRFFSPKSFSLFEMDLKLKKYLLPIKNGFFIEAGANDGIKQSNTYLYEKKYGWRGLLIEPIPSLFAQCKRNRKSIVENYALGMQDNVSVTMKDFGLMSIVETEEHEQYIKNALRKYGKPEIVTVPTIRLSTLLDKHNITHIDFLSLDVEAYELEALKGIDFNRHRPTFVLVEDGKKKEIIELMLQNNYKIVDMLSAGDVLFQTTLV